MASLKEIKTRIASVKNTLKITSSMKLVASAKLHKAQMAIENLRPYEQRLEGMLQHLLATSYEQQTTGNHAGEVSLLQTRSDSSIPPKRVAIVAVSSNASLCGGFNNNLIRYVEQAVKAYEETLGEGSVILIPVGRKVAQAMSAHHSSLITDYIEIGEKPTYAEAASLASRLREMYLHGEVDKVEFLYTHYKNMAVQTLTREQFLPIVAIGNDEQQTEKGKQDSAFATEFLIEPSISELLDKLLPQALSMRLYAMLLDSSAAEHAARTFAMQTATDNGEDLLQELNLQYNKVRQQSITNELLDIMGGQMR